MILNAKAGPWGKASFMSIVKGAAADYFNQCDSSDPLFRMMYPMICKDQRFSGDPDQGTPDHMAKVFTKLRSCPAYHSKGCKVKIGRWFSWFQA